ncbi:MAG: flagellar export chaperone FlgN [Planctomycetes bacterium]|nr:flagellar export chaperone FlgN [Planctomycetota bacterium]MBI3833889.1 flagellar export chaperone FlgN [Planctomycetota bacterium]
MMTATIETKRISDLCRLFEQLRALYEELGGILQSRLAAMRRADVPAMEDCACQEQIVVRQLQERLGLRSQLMEAVGATIGLPKPAAKQLSMTQLFAYLNESQKSALRTVADALRSAMLAVSNLNRVAAAATREVLNHLRFVFAAVRPVGDGPCYSFAGGRMAVGGAIAFETIG